MPDAFDTVEAGLAFLPALVASPGLRLMAVMEDPLADLTECAGPPLDDVTDALEVADIRRTLDSRGAANALTPLLVLVFDVEDAVDNVLLRGTGNVEGEVRAADLA